MFISEYLGIPKGHMAIDFVDITTDDDTRLFIDPCLIERSSDALSRAAASLMASFADEMYRDMRSDRWHVTHVFDEAHEIHATRLGYGNGRNGKGKTSYGMCDSLNGLCQLVNDIPSISTIQDISVLVEDFAEDCMSDLLTNILRLLLSRFTAEQMEYYGKEPNGIHEIRYWDDVAHCWSSTYEPYWLVDGREILLVPKWWVRKNFLFKAHQYLYTIIIERIQKEDGYEFLTKRDVWRNLERDSEHWEYDKVIEYTLEYPDALDAYHRRMHQHYNRAYGGMDDDDLDLVVYGQYVTETA